MLNVANEAFMVSVILLNVVILSVFMESVVASITQLTGRNLGRVFN